MFHQNQFLEFIQKMNIFKSFVRILLNKKRHNRKCVNGEEETGNDFANNMIQQALNMCGSSSAIHESVPEPIIEETYNEPQNVTSSVKPVEITKAEPKYFNDNGIQYKLEDGKMFKQAWKSVPDEQTDESGNIVYSNYRIINKETGKQIKSPKYIIEHLDWQPLDAQ